MASVKIVLAVQDEQYIEPFLHYVSQSEFAEQFRITAFSQWQAFEHYHLTEEEVADAIVAEPMFKDKWNALSGRELPWIILSEEFTGSEGDERLFKYQSLPVLLQTLSDQLVRPLARRQVRGSPTSTEVIGIYSAAGGSGKTTVALQMSRQMGSEGNKVLYLNLEAVSSVSWGSSTQQEGPDLARLLYDLKAANERKESLQISPAEYVNYQVHVQAEVYEPLANMDEMMEMRHQDMQHLLQYLVESARYDQIILDMDSYPSEATQSALDQCDQIVWLLTDDSGSLQKNSRWLSHLEHSNKEQHMRWMNKTVFIVNRYMGNLVNDFAFTAREELATLPYIPTWKQLKEEDKLQISPIFQRDLMQLCYHLSGGQQTPHGESARRRSYE
ncbi:cellulose biosynthesis protein BcsQ [Paenibacillus shirakamiensis]|uniref:Cellulose biosynthesis protein BcsQ n=1 Tax=Paenibacillus shirakamiensis TaxID=1265935 RepID=A0ABS4JHM8_9BACL|nr:AAA family ATPase [Paenibacillus shirakamiensis]MBP2000560.1 cellulose biosynthesis protein BcsQ [Paenibacillus shirakamiensis]